MSPTQTGAATSAEPKTDLERAYLAGRAFALDGYTDCEQPPEILRDVLADRESAGDWMDAADLDADDDTLYGAFAAGGHAWLREQGL